MVEVQIQEVRFFRGKKEPLPSLVPRPSFLDQYEKQGLVLVWCIQRPISESACSDNKNFASFIHMLTQPAQLRSQTLDIPYPISCRRAHEGLGTRQHIALITVCVFVGVCTGGRNHDGCPILKLTQPNSVGEALLREVKEEGIIEMLIYFTSVPR